MPSEGAEKVVRHAPFPISPIPAFFLKGRAAAHFSTSSAFSSRQHFISNGRDSNKGFHAKNCNLLMGINRL
jgi:hypothetical protein